MSKLYIQLRERSINTCRETNFYCQYGRWPKPAELANFVKYGQKSKPQQKKSKRKTARR